MGWKDRIVLDPRICHGKPTIKGTRIMVTNILGLFRGGYTAPQILAHFPELTDADVQAALDYAISAIEEEKFVLS